jgi:5-formyltetrahydrofolate cyclo-ligase
MPKVEPHMSDNLSAEKAALRSEMMKGLRQMTAEDRESFSDEICERVLEMAKWAEAQSALLFVPLPSEPIITPLKLDCEARKISCVTIPQNARTEADLRLPDSIDLILVPGLAFSKDRHRLGRGGGFFDRLLAGPAKEAFKLGICFSFQIVDGVPTDAHDIVMDAVITDSVAIQG